MPEMFADNLPARNADGEIRPGDTIEEKNCAVRALWVMAKFLRV